MNKKYFSKFNIKDKKVKSELVRAHGMIILLVVALMFVLAISSTLNILLEPVLTLIAVLLLAVVGIISLTVVLSISRLRK